MVGGGIRVLCLAALLAIGLVVSGAFATAAYAVSYDAEGVEVTLDGVTYTCDFLADGTAHIETPVADAGVTVMNVPTTIENAGKTYTVTEMYFGWSTKAANVEELHLPNTLTKMSGWGFNKFSKLKELAIPGSMRVFDFSLQNMASLEKLTFEEGVEELAANMMVSGCDKLKEINLPSSLKLISQSGAFSGASALESIELPEDVVFGDSTTGMFSDCTSLTSIVLPKSLTKIPTGYFSGCTSLTSVTATSEIAEVGPKAFKNCSSLPEVSFPGTLTTIGYSAFEGCENLTSIPDLNHVSVMGESAFQGCKRLFADVDLSSLAEVPAYAFCYAQVSVVKLSDTLRSIGKWAFIWGNLATDLPDTLESIGAYAFYAGSLPETFVIPDSVTSIGSNAFDSTEGVKEVRIGNGLTSISDGLFDDSTVEKIVIDNSEDDITGTDNLPAVEIVYLYESIDDGTGDTVSSEPGAMTLQEVVNAAPDGVETTIEIRKHVKLATTLNIPAGKKIKLTSADPFTVLAVKDTSGDLVNVVEGASLEIAGNVTLRGRYNSGSIVGVKGELVLSEGATILDGTARSTASGVVSIDGANASFTLNGGVIKNCAIEEVYCGVVRASGGARVLVRSGSIRDNRVVAADGDGNYLSSTGVHLTGGASLEMSGGSIADNSGYQGSAVLMLGDEAGSGKRATFLMSGGSIENNRSNKVGKRTPSGAVHVEGNAEFTMTGGRICGNSAAADGKGGGVCVVDPGVQGIGTEMNTVFAMRAEGEAEDGSASCGGVISGNTAYCGGGVYSFSNGVTLDAGSITDNTAWNMGGGVYSEGNDSHYSTLHVDNAQVTGNSATEQGGGMWFCPTGDSKIYVQDGGLIARNTSDGVGDDFVFTGFEGDPHTLTLANRVPGGGKVSWYRDGGLFQPNGILASIDTSVPRFVEGGDNGDAMTFVNAAPNVALKSVMTDEAFELGAGQTTLLISGNKAARGGGIGANGGVVVGRDERVSVSVRKVWDASASSHPEKVTVNLLNGATVVDSLELGEDNGWTGTFDDLPKYALDGSEIEYTVAEVAVDGFRSEVTGDMAGGFTVTNTVIPAPPATTDPEPGKPTPDSGNPDSGVTKPGADLPQTGDSGTSAAPLGALAAVALAGSLLARRRS